MGGEGGEMISKKRINRGLFVGTQRAKKTTQPPLNITQRIFMTTFIFTKRPILTVCADIFLVELLKSVKNVKIDLGRFLEKV
jgi:hypothetical protein